MAKRKSAGLTNGASQLSLVEHALCPIDSRKSLRCNQVFETGYFFTDRRRRRRRACVRIFCPLGLSPNDEFYLWGMLALTVAQHDCSGELKATRHYILRQLGVINSSSKGGRQYSELINTLERLSGVQYQNDAFYDPIRKEHRRVSFGFLSYSLPRDPHSTRAWRIAWDPIFFEFVKSGASMMRFNLGLYKKLDTSSRRLYLFLAKMFSYRRNKTHPLELRHLGTDIIGYSNSLSNGDLKIKVGRAIRQLQREELLSGKPQNFVKNSAGGQVVVLYRGESFRKQNEGSSSVESPIDDQLKTLGFDDRRVNYLKSRYQNKLLTEWVDITLAAIEHKGMHFFKKCPQAFLQDNLKHAAKGERTPPDWWLILQKEEYSKRPKPVDSMSANKAGGLKSPTSLKALESLDNATRMIFEHFLAVGQPENKAIQNARKFQSTAKGLKE